MNVGQLIKLLQQADPKTLVLVIDGKQLRVGGIGADIEKVQFVTVGPVNVEDDLTQQREAVLICSEPYPG